MRILVHICCGPCAITVIRQLLDLGHDVTGFFFNPNIHPLAEYMRRREGAAQVAERLGVPVIFADTLPPAEQTWDDPWLRDRADAPFAPGNPPLPPAANPAPWLRAVSGRENNRCAFCWRIRLAHSAATAERLGLDAFTSSLLYSRYQDHEAIRALGEGIAAATDPAFWYEDFRRFWQQGIELSKEWGIYRQPYCGCLFSEYDRYSKPFARAAAEG